MSENGNSSGDDSNSKEEKSQPRLTRRTAAVRAEGSEEPSSTPPPLLDRRISLLGSAEKAPGGSATAKKGSYGSDNVIRVGSAYQAELPEARSAEMEQRYSEDVASEDHLLWTPRDWTPQMEAYLAECRAVYAYSEEQALGLLESYDGDVGLAMKEVEKYEPACTAWSHEEKVQFEQAFNLHGKFFARIRSMMPNKSIAQLVEYYYSWKKKRKYSSYMDACRNESEDETELVFLSEAAVEAAWRCEDCGALTSQEAGVVAGPEGAPRISGRFCLPCQAHYSRTAERRPRPSPQEPSVPPGISLSKKLVEDFLAPADENRRRGPGGKEYASQGELNLDELERKVTAAKRKAGNNYGDLMRAYRAVQCFRPDALLKKEPSAPPSRKDSRTRLTWTWTQLDEKLAVQGFRYCGRDFEAIARIVETKSAEQVKSFYKEHAARWNLEELVQSWESERKRRKEETAREKAAAAAKVPSPQAVITLDDDNEETPKVS